MPLSCCVRRLHQRHNEGGGGRLLLLANVHYHGDALTYAAQACPIKPRETPVKSIVQPQSTVKRNSASIAVGNPNDVERLLHAHLNPLLVPVNNEADVDAVTGSLPAKKQRTPSNSTSFEQQEKTAPTSEFASWDSECNSTISEDSMVDRRADNSVSGIPSSSEEALMLSDVEGIPISLLWDWTSP